MGGHGGQPVYVGHKIKKQTNKYDALTQSHRHPNMYQWIRSEWNKKTVFPSQLVESTISGTSLEKGQKIQKKMHGEQCGHRWQWRETCVYLIFVVMMTLRSIISRCSYSSSYVTGMEKDCRQHCPCMQMQTRLSWRRNGAGRWENLIRQWLVDLTRISNLESNVLLVIGERGVMTRKNHN